MTLAAGTKLGPYQIVSSIGAGGMGEVYKATDTRLDRTVAIKVLLEHFAENPERKQRFELEAKAISRLNHPHICTLHDVGHEDGVDFLVMEYIEGETLAERLAKGPLPLEQVLIYGAQIADALDKAHGERVIHRDLKPGNIIITKSGPKLVDFGLAKLQQGGAALDFSAVTQQKPLTQEGTILGTFQYMAPEQFEGREADARTDIFAFGAVLYEMLTGRKAFQGESKASLIHAIMGVDPAPASTLQPTTPPALDHVIRSCLAKDPDERSPSAGEVERHLRWIREAGADAVTEVPVASTGSNRERWVWAGALLLTAISIWALMRSPPPRVARLSILAPSTEPFEITINHQDVTFTPDGARIVYTATPGRLLVVRPLDQLGATPLRGSEGGRNPFVSHDGNWVGFLRRRYDEEDLHTRRPRGDHLPSRNNGSRRELG